LKRLAETTKTGDFDSGAKAVDDALAELDRRAEEHRAASRRSRETLLEAGVEQDLLRRDPVAVAQRIEAIAGLDATDGNPASSQKYWERWDIFHAEGREKGGNLSLEVALEMARRMLDSARDGDQRGTALHFLGMALTTLGEREGGKEKLQQAIEAFREALKEFARERVPLFWARAENGLGLALTALGEHDGDAETLRKAVGAFEDALQELTRGRVPLAWAATKVNLANAFEALYRRESDTAMLHQAVKAYREALGEFTCERAPLGCAGALVGLGGALTALGEKESSKISLRHAVKVYRKALEVISRERVPQQWAHAQNNLGTALRKLCELGSSTARLEEAIKAFTKP
jgi:tetratricopeptide (TPR) repeat protein